MKCAVEFSIMCAMRALEACFWESIQLYSSGVCSTLSGMLLAYENLISTLIMDAL